MLGADGAETGTGAQRESEGRPGAGLLGGLAGATEVLLIEDCAI